MANVKKIILNGTTYDIVDSTAVHTVDTAISSSSTNPVQNKVIKAALDKKGTLISLSTATATALLDYYSFSVPAADITAINTAHDGVIISFGSSSAFGANETFVGFLNQTTLWNGISYLAYSGTFSSATSLDSNIFVLLLPTTGNGGTGYIKAKNVATTGDVADALDDAEDYADTKIVAAIEALDAAVSGLGTNKTITALLETNGVISATASNISIAGSQVTSGTIAEARLPSTVVKKSDEQQTTNPFAPGSLRGPYISKIDNAFYAAPKRWTVTSTPTGSVDPLFNGDYESTRVIAAGTSCTFNMKFDTETNGYFPGYPYGYILVSFYFQNIPASVTGRAYCNYESHGIGWHDIDFSPVPESNVSNTVYRGRQAWYNISEIEITVTADASKSANITQIEMHLDRPNSAKNPFLSKYAAETLYYNLTAPSFTGNLRGELNYGTCATAAGTAAKVVTCTGFVLVAGARISVRFTNGSTSTGTMQLNVNGTGAKNCGIYLYNGSWMNCVNRCNKNEVLEFVYDGTYWVTITPYTLRNYGNYSSRLTSANVSLADFGLQYFLATSAMTTGKPPTDAAILNMNWDNGTIWGMQLAVGVGHGRVFTRAQNGSSAWGDWKELPRLSSTPTDGQIIVYDAQSGNGMLKGGPALDATDTTKFLRHDGSWAEIGGGVAPVEDTDVFLSRAVNFGENKYKFPSLVGGTVAWNQLIQNGNFASVSKWEPYHSSYAVSNNEATLTISESYSDGSIFQDIANINNHVVLVSADIKVGTATSAQLYISNTVSKNVATTSTSYTRLDALVKCGSTGYLRAQFRAKGAGATAMAKNYAVCDLTLALGPTIADYIYSLETATTGAGVNWFKQYFPKSYYPYNAGALISVNPTGAETTGVNLFDKSKIVTGYIDNNSGNLVSSTTRKSTDYISVIGNVDYYIKSDQTSGAWGAWYDSNKTYISGITGYQSTSSSSKIYSAPVNAAYMRLTIANSASDGDPDTFSVSVSNPLYNGTYYPYTHHSYPISPVELRGILKLDANNKLYCDGDVRASDGTVTRKYREVNLTSFSGAFGATSNGYAVYITTFGIDRTWNVLCNRFTVSGAGYTTMPVYSWVGGSGALATFTFILPSTVTSLAEANTWLQNNPTTVLIPLATPTTESSAALPVPQVVYDGGIESYIDERDVPMLVGQDATYMDATSAIGELMDSGLVPSSGGGGSSESEGIFTVTDGLGSSDTWSYYKIGKQVTVSGKYTGSSTTLSLQGLPFTVKFKQAFFLPVQITSPSFQLYSCQVTLTAGAKTIGTYGYGSNPTSSWLSFAQAAGTQITFSYITDD